MTTFADPLGQYSFSLPLGWAYSIRRSHLITVTFVLVDRIDERITVHAVPTYRADVTDAQWRADARQAAFRPELSVHDYTLGPKIALFAHVPEVDGDGFAQAVVMRGRHIDVVIRHENPTDDTKEKLTSALSMVVRTLAIPTDLSPPLELADQNLVHQRLQDASDLGQREEWKDAAKSAAQAMIWARDTYLRSAHGGALFPEVPAVVTVIDALILQFRAMLKIDFIRDADLLINRAAFTLRELPIIAARKDQVMNGLQEQKKTIEEVQRAVIELVWPNAPSDQKLLAKERHEFLTHNSAVAFERGEKEVALVSAKIAVDDVLMLLAGVLESGEAGGDDEPIFMKDGVELPAETAREVAGRFIEGELADTMRVLATIHRSLGEVDDARAANTLLIDLSQRLSSRAPTARGHFEPREGQRHHLAAALLDQLASYILFGSGQTQDVAWQLDQAQLLLEELKEGADLRSRERFLREVWGRMRGHELDMRFNQTPWVRHNVISALPEVDLRTLTDWALSPVDWLPGTPLPSAGVPAEVLGEGPTAIVAYAGKENPEHEAVSYWRATGTDANQDGFRQADEITSRWLGEANWRRSWAIAALRALDPTLPLAHRGLLAGLEFARAILVQPATLVGAELDWMIDNAPDQSSSDGDATSEETAYSPTFDTSPFGHAVVRRVLTALDGLVALQEVHESRFEDVLNDLGSAEQPDFKLAKSYLDDLPDGVLFRQSIASGGVGSAIGLMLRHASEEAEQRGDAETVQSLSSPLIRLVARYSCTADFLSAVHRVAAATNRGMPSEIVLNVMEHVRLAALWLGDAELEASAQHAVGLILRQGNIRGIPGVIEAIPAFQRAATLLDQLGDTIGAAGALTDLSAMLIGYREGLEDAEDGRDWPNFARRYLYEAMARLVLKKDHPYSTAYLGEGYQNLARLYLNQVAGLPDRLSP